MVGCAPPGGKGRVGEESGRTVQLGSTISYVVRKGHQSGKEKRDSPKSPEGGEVEQLQKIWPSLRANKSNNRSHLTLS